MSYSIFYHCSNIICGHNKIKHTTTFLLIIQVILTFRKENVSVKEDLQLTGKIITVGKLSRIGHGVH